MPLAKAPVLEGYQFLGWKSNEDSSVYSAGTKLSVITDLPQTGDITLTAQWEKITTPAMAPLAAAPATGGAGVVVAAALLGGAGYLLAPAVAGEHLWLCARQPHRAARLCGSAPTARPREHRAVPRH